MKKTILILLLVFITFTFTVCNRDNSKNITTEKTKREKSLVLTPEALSFPIGEPYINELFNGTVYLSQLVNNDEIFNSPSMSYVVFEPGIINKWHIHSGGQILIATDGIGYHQIEGQPVEIMYPGDVAKCPPGIKHWHGAASGTWFAHIAIGTNPEMRGLQIFDFISEAEYNALPQE
jgi:quercetin dioxygenase-like cupin family protein